MPVIHAHVDALQQPHYTDPPTTGSPTILDRQRAHTHASTSSDSDTESQSPTRTATRTLQTPFRKNAPRQGPRASLPKSLEQRITQLISRLPVLPTPHGHVDAAHPAVAAAVAELLPSAGRLSTDDLASILETVSRQVGHGCVGRWLDVIISVSIII